MGWSCARAYLHWCFCADCCVSLTFCASTLQEQDNEQQREGAGAEMKVEDAES